MSHQRVVHSTTCRFGRLASISCFRLTRKFWVLKFTGCFYSTVTSYMWKYQGNFGFSVHDSFKNSFVKFLSTVNFFGNMFCQLNNWHVVKGLNYSTNPLNTLYLSQPNFHSYQKLNMELPWLKSVAIFLQVLLTAEPNDLQLPSLDVQPPPLCELMGGVMFSDRVGCVCGWVSSSTHYIQRGGARAPAPPIWLCSEHPLYFWFLLVGSVGE